MTQQEQLRQHYLQAMGIESYLPRWALPGAAASSFPVDMPWEDDLPADVESSEAPVPEQPDVAAVAAELVPASARPPLTVELEAEERRPRSVAPAAPVAHSRPLSFTLSVWQISEHILILDSRQVNLALPVERLLQNMALALGLGSRGLPEAEFLRWPLPGSPELDVKQSEADARARVQAFLAARAERQTFRHVLLMGAPAIRFALHREQQTEGSRAALGKSFVLELDGFSTEAIALPSLAAILQHPDSKPAVWAAIRHLRAARA